MSGTQLGPNASFLDAFGGVLVDSARVRLVDNARVEDDRPKNDYVDSATSGSVAAQARAVVGGVTPLQVLGIVAVVGLGVLMVKGGK